MEKAIDDFLTRFAAGAGPGYHWELLGDARVLRARTDPSQRARASMCPLTAQFTLEEGGLPCPAGYWRLAREALPLTETQASAIVEAADRVEGAATYDPGLRARLLRICGLGENTHGD